MDRTIQQLLDQQNALAEFGSFAFRSHVLTDILDQATKLCATTIGALCKICRYRPEHNDLILEAGYGWKPEVIGIALSDADASTPGGRAFATRQSVIISDLREETTYTLPPLYSQHNIVSTANVVIMSGNGNGGPPYGILEVDSIHARAYDDHVVSFLTGFANILAEAVDTIKRRIALENALAEKEMLARELQHRVRNNLHLINSMLDMEAISGDASPERFQDIANRVRALATMYDHLLGTGMGRSLALDQYLLKLCDTLRTLQPPNVELRPHPMSPVMIDLDTATLLGIAITEIITNSFKHAFPTGAGTVELVLENHTSPPKIRVIDNGIGIDLERAQASKRHGLGLVRRLVEQAKGTLSINKMENGTACEIQLSDAAD